MSQNTLLKVENLQKKFGIKKGILGKTTNFIYAVDQVSFSLQENQTLGIVGESGSGKSTLCRLILQLINSDKGKIWLEDKEITNLSFRQLKPIRKKMQMIFQDPSDSLNPKMNLLELIEEPLVIYKIKDKAYRYKEVKKLLDLVGLPSSATKKYIHEFSGGQKQRVGIARALALSPKLIIADEPVSALDISVQAQILNLLKSIQEETKISYLLVSHDLNVIRFMSQNVLVMYLGRVIESGNCNNIFKQPQHPYTKTLIDSILNIKKKKELKPIKGEIPNFLALPKGCYFNPRCEYATQKCRQQYPPFEKKNSKAINDERVACWHNLAG